MTIRNFEGFVVGAREGFKNYLRQDMTEESKTFVKGLFEQCTNNFEEETLMENLSEVFQDYVNQVKAA